MSPAPADQPLVSVVVPVRNNAGFLGAALRSILGGEYRNHEVIVVDNDSSDGSGDVARQFPVRYVRQPDRGQAGGRNRGIGHDNTQILASGFAPELRGDPGKTKPAHRRRLEFYLHWHLRGLFYLHVAQ